MPPTSPFLALPPELRIQIYLTLLPPTLRIRPLSPFAWHLSEHRDPLALLRTCHLIRNEARPLLFSDCHFHIELHTEADLLHCRAWIDGAGDGLVGRMKRFGVGAVVGAGVVVAEVRVVEGVGVVVGFEEVGGEFAESLSCVFGSCPVGGGGGDDAGSTGRGQRAVLLSGVEGGEWMGCFSVADVKAIVGAIRGCIEFHNARMADQVKEGFRAW